ncbi:MAG: GTPase ObgE [Clostridia bacterium]|nr:GTPase ObgE [Clostridia bacterium]
MFIDVAKITIKGGDGGHGKVSFHREKYINAGGPDGGDGGQGGNVVFVVDRNMSTLMDFKYKRKYFAEDGQGGGQKKCFGKNGKDLVIKVPEGTLIKDAETGKLIWDMSSSDEPFIAAKGGRGGWGNTHFATPTRQTPRFAKAGLPGQRRDVILELKLIADVGLLGFPNVGKSTFLSVVSAARPEIANYHFTTLTPNLGVVRISDELSFVMADIPGLIEGASEGVGLGHDFLRHVDRCRLLIHIVDVSGSEGRDPIEDFETINRELKNYSAELSERPQIVVGNKVDIITDDALLKKFESYVRKLGYEFYTMSAATASGTREVINAAAERLSKIPKPERFEPDYFEPEKPIAEDPNDITITREGDAYVVEGDWLYVLLNSVNMDDYESMAYFQRTLRRTGVIDKLTEAGVKDGDTVIMYNLEFDFME